MTDPKCIEIPKDLNKKRGTIRGRLTRFKRYIDAFKGETLSVNQLAEIKLRRQGFSSLLAEFLTAQEKIEELLPDSEQDKQLDIRDEFESEYYSLMAQIECLVTNDEPVNNKYMPNGSLHSIKLPTISLPTYDGSYEHWLEFRDTFLSLVHNSKEITNIQKFHYLKSSLKGSAELVIVSLEFSAANYDIAWELLLNRYNNHRLLVHNHVKALFSIQPLSKESPVLIRKLIDNVLKNLRALKLLGEPTDKWDTLVIYMLVSKLDSTTEREWEQHKTSLTSTSNSEAKLTIDDLLFFLRNRADMLETLIVTHSKVNTYDNRKPIQTQNTQKVHNCHHISQKTVDKQQTYKNNKSCLLCSGKHSLYSCQSFLDYNVQQRSNFVKHKNLCENCLRAGHSAITCRFGPCRKCDKKHNTLIHRDEINNHNTANCSDSNSNDYSKGSETQISCSVSTHAKLIGCAQSPAMKPVLLSTALVEVIDRYGKYHQARALLDNGSERCIITQSLCDKLKTQLLQSTQRIKGVGGLISQCTQICDIKIKSLIGTYSKHLKCLVLPYITSPLPSVAMPRELISVPDGMPLADPNYNSRQPIDLLLGADVFWDLLKEGQIRLRCGPVLQNTQLGWIISGPLYFNNKNNKLTNFTHCNVMQSFDEEFIIDEQLRKFWELEELPGQKVYEQRNEEERACEDTFTTTTTRVVDGRFCVRIPLKHPPDSLGETRKQAEQRFFTLERRLQRDATYKKLYCDFINEYINLGHMTRVSDYGTPHYFMPHHGVFREHAVTTRLRVVFDASAASSSGLSLNNLQCVGPPIQGDLLAILLRFRENKYVACADVEKMYRQVLIDENQRDLQLVLWRDHPSNPIGVYRLNTVTYGTASAAYLSCRCLKQLAQECKDPEVARTIDEDFYVDDAIFGSSSLDKLKYICQETTKVLMSGCFPLRKWTYNFDPNDEDTTKIFSSGENSQNKTLGVGWKNKSDELYFHTKWQSNPYPITKRIILSGSSQVYDPLGLLSPTIILAKVLLQKLWLLKIDWDEPVPHSIAHVWTKFTNELENLNVIRIPRYVIGDNPINLELHIFTDSSLTAYGACAYVRTIGSDDKITVRLLCSKGKVTPVKPISIPRAELCGALVGARLYARIVKSLRSTISKVVFWTDSTIVLGWLRTPPNLLKTFVQNRTTEIHELTKNHPWRHVRSEDNPADVISRGRHLDTLWSTAIWWNGPQFLHKLNSENNLCELSDNIELPELKSNNILSFVSTNPDTEISLFPFSRFSQFNRMKHAMAYCLRFIHNTRNNADRHSGALTVDELREAVCALTRLSQRESYGSALDCMLTGKRLIKGKHANLIKLNPIVDQNKIMRVGGRIGYGDFAFDKKHPILLSSKHHFTILLFRHEHKRLLHAAPQLLLFTLREMWWPVGGRNLARKIVHDCVICARIRGKTVTPIMGNIIKERLEPGFPFLYTGVDYAGPVLILNRKGRGAQTVKAYICLFICFVTRAVHLELVSDLTSDAYLLSLKRFISRRGKPAEIFSDNGKNFVGLKNEFAKFLSNTSNEVEEYAKTQSIKFKFIPPYASHFGGLWEAGVKSCKYHMQRVVGNARLTFEEFSTALTQIEAVLNSRPLSPMSSDPHDLQPLCPALFLVGRPLTAPVCADMNYIPEHRLTRYQRVEQIRQHFWARWSKEYVSELQARNKWSCQADELKENTLVVIKDDNTPPLKWNLGRIVKTYPGKDGVTRVADIKTTTGIIRRAFSKICPLFHEDF